MDQKKFERLQELCGEIGDLGGASALLGWDQQTYMPPRGAEARAKQMSTLSGVIHERVTAPELGDLLGELQQEDGEAWQGAFLRELAYRRERSMKLPASLVRETALETARAFDIWVLARRRKDFKEFAPALAKVIDLTRQAAECWGYEETPWNALVPDYERGMTAASIEKVLAPLRGFTSTLLDKIRSRPQVETRFLDQKWSIDRQREFGLRVARDIGYDMNAGRQDIAAHPFCTTIGFGDVRITTRYAEDNPLDSLLATIHESGHALYEMGMPEKFARSPLQEAPSLGMHESQSRFWEVRVGHSRAFWKHYQPIMSQYFPGQLDGVDAEAFYRAANRIEPGYIRVESDEVCYNLHVILRFELELLIFNGELSVEDLPAEWNRRFEAYFGIKVPDDSKGCLQDVHWSGGAFGYFPTYSLGNVYNAMLVEKMNADMPEMWDQVASGEFARILGWLRENIHQHGAVYHAPELIKRVTGKDVDAAPLMKYLETKYQEIYGF